MGGKRWSLRLNLFDDGIVGDLNSDPDGPTQFYELCGDRFALHRHIAAPSHCEIEIDILDSGNETS